MRLRALLLGAAIAVIPASAASAQFMDLPGMDAVSGGMPEGAAAAQPSGGQLGAAQTEPQDPLDLPGTGVLPVRPEAPAQAEDTEPAPAPAGSSDDALPSSGAPLAALALAGVALVSSGRLLREFVPRG